MKVYVLVSDPDQPTYTAFSTPEAAFAVIQGEGFTPHDVNREPIESWGGETSEFVYTDDEFVCYELLVLEVNGSPTCTSPR